ncbi:hypothetical protein ACM66B_003921 [Microbotryomycetes sp. NB124-2]
MAQPPAGLIDPMTLQHSYRDPELERKLRKSLGPEFIKERQGPGGSKIAYMEGWQAISLANEVFGPTGWSTEVREQGVDHEYFNDKLERWTISSYAVVRVTLRDGSFREDVGTGSAENMKGKADAMTKVRKEAVTDGMKRALRQFGEVLGNCVYNPKYRDFVKQMKAPEPKFDARELHRAAQNRAPPPAPPAAAPAPIPAPDADSTDFVPFQHPSQRRTAGPPPRKAPLLQRNATVPANVPNRLALPPPPPPPQRQAQPQAQPPPPPQHQLLPLPQTQIKPDPTVRPTTADMLGLMNDCLLDDEAYLQAVEGDSGFCDNVPDTRLSNETKPSEPPRPQTVAQPEPIKTTPPTGPSVEELNQKRQQALLKQQTNKLEQQRKNEEARQAALRKAAAMNISAVPGPRVQTATTSAAQIYRAHTTGSMVTKGVIGQQQPVNRPMQVPPNGEPGFASARGIKRKMPGDENTPQTSFQAPTAPQLDPLKSFRA